MPHEITERRRLLEVLAEVDCLSELLERHEKHYVHELDLEVIVYGRGYTGGAVGPYARLWEYRAGETVTHKDDWAVNSFYIPVDGELEVCDGSPLNKVGGIAPGHIFGEMAIIEGEQRSKTIRVPEDAKAVATVLELQRPALRLLRKLPKFERVFDEIYLKHGLDDTLRFLREHVYGSLAPALLERLGGIARFKVYGNRHPLVAAGERIEDVLFINKGWVEIARVLDADGDAASGGSAKGTGEAADVRFLGAGNCLGLEADPDTAAVAAWPYSATAQARTEVLEIPLDRLRADPELWRALRASLSTVSEVDEQALLTPVADPRAFKALQKEITTGVVDGTNLLIMDMDLCVRCGNCSLACHKVHGQSRLLRRGIHIERPVRIGSSSTQHVLSPSVCMHCQDPECLTGCPTGAISRTAAALIDISPDLCIGCGDCATQCPYNAISMIPRRKHADPPAPGLPARLRRWLSLSPPPLPAVADDTKNLLAIKCNLCAGTALNPEGATQKAYSCEENCPTGALVRVNPREYFSEAKNTVGIVYQDLTHAIGRNIHKRDTPLRVLHAVGLCLLFALAYATFAAVRRYGLDARLMGAGWLPWLTMRWLTGILGFVGIFLTMLYPFRKQIYTKRRGALRYWMWAHAYVGACAGLLLVWHGGSHAGGTLTLALMICFDLVIASGLFGLACYLFVPRVMTSIEGDPLLLEDLQQRHKELCAALTIIDTQNPELRPVIRGEVRRRFFSLSFLLRQYTRREPLTELLDGLCDEFNAEASRRNFSDTSRATLLDAVETTATLRRVQSLIYLHKLLRLWVAPHVVFTSLMLLLMLVHIAQVIFFAVR